MVVYHYSTIGDWPDIVKGSWKSGNEPGLGASRRLGHDDMEAWRTSAVFALLHPEPQVWTQNLYFEDVWNWLKSDIGDLLLEIDVDPEIDNVFVMDRGHLEGFLYQDKTGIPERYLHPTRRIAERKKMESKVSLKDYLAKEQELQYSLPEVIFPQNVPLDKIRVSSSQPALEHKIDKYNLAWREDLKRRVQAIPELQAWWGNYEQRLFSANKESR